MKQRFKLKLGAVGICTIIQYKVVWNVSYQASRIDVVAKVCDL